MRNFKCGNNPAQSLFIVTNIVKINFLTFIIVNYLFKPENLALCSLIIYQTSKADDKLPFEQHL